MRVFIEADSSIRELPFVSSNGTTVTIPKPSKGIYLLPEDTTFYNFRVEDGVLVYDVAPSDWRELGKYRKIRGIRLKVRKKDTRTTLADGTGGLLKAAADDIMMEFAAQQLQPYPIYEIPEGSLYTTEEYIYMLYVTYSNGFVYNQETNKIEFQMGTGSEVMRPEPESESNIPLIQCEILGTCRIEGDLIIAE